MLACLPTCTNRNASVSNVIFKTNFDKNTAEISNKFNHRNSFVCFFPFSKKKNLKNNFGHWIVAKCCPSIFSFIQDSIFNEDCKILLNSKNVDLVVANEWDIDACFTSSIVCKPFLGLKLIFFTPLFYVVVEQSYFYQNCLLILNPRRKTCTKDK